MRPGIAIGRQQMSQLGHSRHFDGLPMTSGLPLEADIVTAGRHVSKAPSTEVVVLEKMKAKPAAPCATFASVTSSASAC
jgi:hypothetical protein